MFHCNELPLRHLMLHLDGTTCGRSAFTGSVGRALENCHTLPIIEFEPKENNLPKVLQDVDESDISKDQKYLYDNNIFDPCLCLTHQHLAVLLDRKSTRLNSSH